MTRKSTSLTESKREFIHITICKKKWQIKKNHQLFQFYPFVFESEKNKPPPLFYNALAENLPANKSCHIKRLEFIINQHNQKDNKAKESNWRLKLAITGKLRKGLEMIISSTKILTRRVQCYGIFKIVILNSN